MILFNFPVKVWTYIHCLKNQIHTRLATVHLAQTPTGQVNHEPPCQTLRQKFEKTDGPYIVPWRSMDVGSARPLGEVNSWAEDVSQRKQSLHSPDVQIQGVSAESSLAGLSCQDSAQRRRRGNSSGSLSPSYAVSLVQTGGLGFTASELTQEPMPGNKHSTQGLCIL